jgi:hypothetical protein
VDLIWAKYLRGRDLYADEVPTHASQFWNAIQKIEWYFKLGAKHKVRSGRRSSFWLDWWSGSGPLRAMFPRLFSYCETLFISVLGGSLGSGGSGSGDNSD